jgi:hypothetical protein
MNHVAREGNKPMSGARLPDYFTGLCQSENKRSNKRLDRRHDAPADATNLRIARAARNVTCASKHAMNRA